MTRANEMSRVGLVCVFAILTAACGGKAWSETDDPQDTGTEPEGDTVCAGREGCINLEEASWILEGPYYDSFGYRLGFVGDLNADGHEDLVAVSQPAGVYYGPFEGESSYDLADAFIVADRGGIRSFFGHQDASGDGVGDLVIVDSSAEGYACDGAAYLLEGPVLGGPELDEAWASYSCGSWDWNHTIAVTAQGEGMSLAVHSYDLPDSVSLGVLVFATLEEGSHSADDADALRYGTYYQTYYAADLAPGGDVDGDGVDDLLVGTPNYRSEEDQPGTAYLLLGPVSGTAPLTDARAVFEGENEGDLAGEEVVIVGDTAGDGTRDVAVGAFGWDGEGEGLGRVYLFLQPPEGAVGLDQADAIVSGLERNAWHIEDRGLGSAIAGGDLDGDGRCDLVVSSPYSDHAPDGSGSIYAFLGPLEGQLTPDDAAVVLYCDETPCSGGYALDGAVDVDGDGQDDLLVGAPGWGQFEPDNTEHYTPMPGGVFLVEGRQLF